MKRGYVLCDAHNLINSPEAFIRSLRYSLTALAHVAVKWVIEAVTQIPSN
jgi:hypothetical protein